MNDQLILEATSQTQTNTEAASLIELDALELTFVGGGTGAVIFG